MRVDHSNSGIHKSEETVVKRNERSHSAAAGKDARGSDQADRASSADASGAKAEISARAKDFSNAKAIATETPDIRENRVDDLKKRIQEGSYKIDSQSIADRMVDEHLRSPIR